MTRDMMLRQTIEHAVQTAFKVGSVRTSDGSIRPQLSREDCQHIADVAHNSTRGVNFGIHGRRTIHGGKR